MSSGSWPKRSVLAGPDRLQPVHADEKTSGPRRRDLMFGGLAAACVTRFLAPSETRADDMPVLTFDGLYRSFGVLGFQFSERVMGLRGQPVRMSGYMAPPLKAESSFFVLTRQPLAICPFCQTDADWPVDIVVVMMRTVTPLVSAGRRVVVTGRLEVGSATDEATGFVSQIRLVDAGFNAT